MSFFRGVAGASKKRFHPQAADEFVQNVLEFASALALQAKLFAFERGDNEVQSTHVRDALKMVNQNRAETWKKKLGAVLGLILFGSFANGLVAQLSAGSNSISIVNAIVGPIGALLILYGVT